MSIDFSQVSRTYWRNQKMRRNMKNEEYAKDQELSKSQSREDIAEAGANFEHLMTAAARHKSNVTKANSTDTSATKLASQFQARLLNPEELAFLAEYYDDSAVNEAEIDELCQAIDNCEPGRELDLLNQFLEDKGYTGEGQDSIIQQYFIITSLYNKLEQSDNPFAEDLATMIHDFEVENSAEIFNFFSIIQNEINPPLFLIDEALQLAQQDSAPGSIIKQELMQQWLKRQAPSGKFVYRRIKKNDFEKRYRSAWYCDVCKNYRNLEERHCPKCNKCSYGLSLPCQWCGV